MFVMTEKINGKTPSDDITLSKSLSTRHTFTPFVLQGAKSSLQMPFAPCHASLSLPSTSERNLALTQEGFVSFNSLMIAQHFRSLIWEIQSTPARSHSLIPLDKWGEALASSYLAATAITTLKIDFGRELKKLKVSQL